MPTAEEFTAPQPHAAAAAEDGGRGGGVNRLTCEAGARARCCVRACPDTERGENIHRVPEGGN
jgi:hypothetical protein